MAKYTYEKTDCSKCGEWSEIEEQEVCGEMWRNKKGIMSISLMFYARSTKIS